MVQGFAGDFCTGIGDGTLTVWVNTPFDTLPGEGGRPMRYWLLCRAMAEKGHEVVLWSSDFHHVTKTRRALEPVYEADGFQVRLVPTMPYPANVGLRRVLSHWNYAHRWSVIAREAVAAKHLRPPDGILTSLPPLELFREAARMRAMWGSHLVVDVQDAWPETFQRLLPRGLRRLAPLVFLPARHLARQAYRRADAVTAVAETYLDLAREAGCRGALRHFPLATPLPLLTPQATPNEGQPIRLGYVGNLGAGYDIQTLIVGVRQLAADAIPVTLTVAGDGPWRERLLDAIGQGAPIAYRGYLNQQDMQACLAGCDAGVVPMFASSWVAVPNKVMDYAAAGLAIINGLKGEAQTLIDRYAAGLPYETGSAASLAAAVRRYADDRDLLARHRQAARRMAEAEFDAARIYPAMAEWLIGASGGGWAKAPGRLPPEGGTPARML